MSVAPTDRLRSLPGGLRLPPNKALSTATGIVTVDLPAELVIPLQQHAGNSALPVVNVGDKVLGGDVVGEPQGNVSSYIHATTSGTVTGVERRALPQRGEPTGLCVLLKPDGNDRWRDVAVPGEDRTARLEAIYQAGLVGLGGATYPAAQKLTQGLSSGIDTVIMNGVECESYISCDDRLMREAPASVVSGLKILLDLLDAKRGIIAVESDKPEAWEALQTAAQADPDERFDWVPIPAVYPSGAEDQLVYLVTGREVPSGGLPSDLGILVHNAGTIAAIDDLVTTGRPLTSRIVTVTGEGIARPGNYRVRLGTPIADVVAAAGGYNDAAKRLIIGGPMTGITLTDDALPVTKSCNCLLITGPAVLLSPEPERACIRCGECAAHCPVQLLPQSLFHYAPRENAEQLLTLGLRDCIECGCCDLVCPSHIPLTHTFRQAKHAVNLRSNEKMRARRAEERFKAHVARHEEAAAATASARAEKRRAASADAIAAIVKRRKRDADSDE